MPQKSKMLRYFCAVFALFAACSVSVAAQTTAFTYQGRFTDSSVSQPTNGTYTMKFRLYDALANGNQVGSELTSSVTVTNGVFTTSLDFATGPFAAGQPLWLEIQVGTTTLTPRQKIESVPYAIRAIGAGSADSLSSLCNPCVTSAQIVSLDGSKITGTVTDAANASIASSVSTAAGSSIVTAINAGSATINTANVSGDVELAPSAQQTTSSTNDLINLKLNGTGTLGTSGTNDLLSLSAGGTYSTGSLDMEWFRVDNAGGILAMGTWDGENEVVGVGTIPATGNGTRMMWYGAKGAFRVGYVNNGAWDDANVGQGSFAGGMNNRASGRLSTAFGNSNVVSGIQSTAIGSNNTVSGTNSFAHGSLNTISGNNATALGSQNTIGSSANSGAFTFGLLSQANASQAYAIGERATVSSTRAMVISLGPSFGVATNDAGTSTFTVRAANGIYLGTNTGTPSIPSGRFIETSTGAYLTSTGVWTNTSSRDLKTNFTPVDTRSILQKILNLPIQSWNYKSEEGGVLHIGAVSQDFYQAFKLGDSDRSIATVDADGVAFAAIQGLYAELKDRDAIIRRQEQQLTQFQQQLNQQQAMIDQLKQMVCAGKPKTGACQ
jgi:hypothetical protein